MSGCGTGKGRFLALGQGQGVSLCFLRQERGVSVFFGAGTGDSPCLWDCALLLSVLVQEMLLRE